MLCLQKNHPKLLAYVIGIHAVQFGNNWMKKIPRIAILDKAYRLIQQASSNLVVRGIFLNSIISKLDKHVVLLGTDH